MRASDLDLQSYESPFLKEQEREEPDRKILKFIHFMIFTKS